jgi:hypothetical protein
MAAVGAKLPCESAAERIPACRQGRPKKSAASWSSVLELRSSCIDHFVSDQLLVAVNALERHAPFFCRLHICQEIAPARDPESEAPERLL